MQEQKPPVQVTQMLQRRFGVLFHHDPHRHVPVNVNAVQKEEQEEGGFNTLLAVWLTQHVGSMWTAYTFVILAVIGLFAILGLLSPIVALLVAWTSQTLIQLVLLPVIMVGQNVLGRKSELLAEEQFKTTMSTYHDIEEIMKHLSAQDSELLHQTKMLIHLLEKNGITLQQLQTEGATTSHLVDPFTQPQATGDVSATAAPAATEKQNT